MKRLLAVLLGCVSQLAIAQTDFRIFPDTSGTYTSHIRLAPTYVDARVLAAGVGETHTVPSGVRFVVFSTTCTNFYAKRGGAAAEPAVDVTDGSASELNPAAWFIEGVSSIGLISPTACTVTLSFYK